MECPNCKKELADNAKTCPNCGYDFTEVQNETLAAKINPFNINVTWKQVAIGLLVVFVFCIIMAFVLPENDNPSHNQQTQSQASTWTQEDIKQAEDFIITLEATGLVKEIKDTCTDGSKGCYYFIIDESLWDNSANYETKQQLQIASEIYSSSKKPYKFYEGKGYMSGKKLYDIWGIK